MKKPRRWLALADALRWGVKLSRADDERVREQARTHLARRLGRLKGVPQKLGQLLSMGTDGEAAEAYRETAEGGEALPWETLRPALEEAWQRPPEEVCSMIDPEGRSASLSQVHRARLRDGRLVALKIQIPGIAEALEGDLDALGLLTRMAAPRRGFDGRAYRDQIISILSRELDFVEEARMQTAYREALPQDVPLVVPEIIPELSGPRVIVAHWEPSLSLSEAAGWDPGRRRTLCEIHVRHLLHMMLVAGRIHADPHSGNLAYRRDPALVLYDFGCVMTLDAEDRQALHSLVSGGDPLEILTKMGFSRDLLVPLGSRLAEAMSVLLEPFRSAEPYDLRGWNRQARVADILEDDRWNLRIAAPPRWILLMKALNGVLSHLGTLQMPVSWARHLPHQSESPLIRRQSASVSSRPAVSPAGARWLRVSVTRDGRQVARVSLPWHRIEAIDELLGDELMRKIRERAFDPQAVISNLKSRGYPTEEVFILEEENSRYRVSLEE